MPWNQAVKPSTGVGVLADHVLLLDVLDHRVPGIGQPDLAGGEQVHALAVVFPDGPELARPLLFDHEVDDLIELLMGQVVGTRDLELAGMLQIASDPAWGEQAVIEDRHLAGVLLVEERSPARDVFAREIVAVADGVAVVELRHQLELGLVLWIDPDLGERIAADRVEAEGVLAGEGLARVLPGDDLIDRDGLQQPGVPQRRVAVGVRLVRCRSSGRRRPATR